MVDFHTHILPNMDDGSHSPEESLRMLDALQTQGVDIVALTSHFDARRETIRSFLARREEAYARLRDALPPWAPLLRLGAEVAYQKGISTLADLTELCLEGTNLLLLEMPFAPWSRATVDEVIQLHASEKVTVMLAHIERYLMWQRPAVWRRLRDSGVVMQSNAEFFFFPVVRILAASMLHKGKIDVLGTDCHNLTTRGAHMDWAFSNMEKRLGSDTIERLKKCSDALVQSREK